MLFSQNDSHAGGLGDVMSALPNALVARGHQVMVVAPRYAQYDDAWDSGVRLRMRCFDSLQEVRACGSWDRAPACMWVGRDHRKRCRGIAMIASTWPWHCISSLNKKAENLQLFCKC